MGPILSVVFYLCDLKFNRSELFHYGSTSSFPWDRVGEKDSESVNQTPARAFIHITYYESSWLGIQAQAKRHRIRQHNLRGCLSVLR